MGRLGAELQQECRQAEAEIGIAVDRELLAMDMRAGVRDGVDQPAALLRQPPGIGLPVIRDTSIRKSIGAATPTG